MKLRAKPHKVNPRHKRQGGVSLIKTKASKAKYQRSRKRKRVPSWLAGAYSGSGKLIFNKRSTGRSIWKEVT